MSTINKCSIIKQKTFEILKYVSYSLKEKPQWTESGP